MEIKTRTALLSLCVAFSLALLKAVASIMTGSISLLASLADSILDLFASFLNYIAIRTSLVPADFEHAYGHGKAESLAGLFQSMIIGGSGIYLLFLAYARLQSPVPLEHEGLGLAVMLISIVASLLLVRHMRRIAKETNSVALAADTAHYATDVLANLGVILSLILSRYFSLPIADPVISILIATYVLYSAWEILRSSIDELMDRQLPDEEIERIGAVVKGFSPDIIGLHDLRTRQAGGRVFIDLHLDIPREHTFVRAHHTTEAVVEALLEAFPGAIVIAHSDPYPGDPANETRALPAEHAMSFQNQEN